MKIQGGVFIIVMMFTLWLSSLTMGFFEMNAFQLSAVHMTILGIVFVLNMGGWLQIVPMYPMEVFDLSEKDPIKDEKVRDGADFDVDVSDNGKMDGMIIPMKNGVAMGAFDNFGDVMRAIMEDIGNRPKPTPDQMADDPFVKATWSEEFNPKDFLTEYNKIKKQWAPGYVNCDTLVKKLQDPLNTADDDERADKARNIHEYCNELAELMDVTIDWSHFPGINYFINTGE